MVRKSFSPNVDQWQVINEAMKNLRSVGDILTSSYVMPEDIQDVQQFCRDACRWDQELAEPPRVEIVVDDVAIIPFEFIPIFRRKGLNITDAASFQQEARSYLGFTSVIKRTIRSAPEQTSRLVGDPDLRARIFQYAGLNAISEVSPVLQKSKTIRNPVFPTRILLQDNFESETGDLLRTATDHIFYFGCHCDTTDSDAFSHYFLLSADGVHEQKMDLAAITSCFVQGGARLRPAPLVFMNACGGASVLPSGGASFPKLFLRYQYGGFIGTESIIPDSTAATFASSFFSNFLGGITLGESLLKARLHLLRRGNPLGILYTAYASSDLLAMARR